MFQWTSLLLPGETQSVAIGVGKKRTGEKSDDNLADNFMFWEVPSLPNWDILFVFLSFKIWSNFVRVSTVFCRKLFVCDIMSLEHYWVQHIKTYINHGFLFGLASERGVHLWNSKNGTLLFSSKGSETEFDKLTRHGLFRGNIISNHVYMWKDFKTLRRSHILITSTL